MATRSGIISTIPVVKLDFNQRKDVKIFMLLNILMGIIFMCIQANEYLITLLITCGIYVVCMSLLFLFNTWSIRYHLFTSYIKKNDLNKATHVYVETEKYNGKNMIVPLEQYQLEDGKMVFYFVFQKIRYFNLGDTDNFVEFKYGAGCTLGELISNTDIQNKEHRDILSKKYGDNSIIIDIPSFKELLIERIYSPLFVFQIFCCLLWCADEYWYYSLFTLCMLIFFESIVVFQQRTNMMVIRKMQNPPSTLYVFREKKWSLISDNDLLPGDIVSLKHSLNDNEKNICPCDVILLNGTCLVDESSLTGESIPQIKETLEKQLYDQEFNLDMIPKVNLISCGTTILNGCGCKNSNIKKITSPPDNGSIGLCVRTGFSTSKGRLLRTIMFSVNHVPNNNLETALFLGFLTIFACIASAYVWIQGTKDPNRSRYKLLLECILILTSVVPPELPIELSLAINSSMVKLFGKNIFCTEPYRIPFAGKLNVCCFDKTGTLTEENLIIEGVVSVNRLNPNNNNNNDNNSQDHIEPLSISSPSQVIQLNKLSDMSVGVIIGCHSLTTLNNDIVGDPIEKCALEQLSAKFTGPDCISYDHKQIRIVKRFAFTSKLKRMSTLICINGENVNQFLRIGHNNNNSNNHYVYTIKGAPETLQTMFNNLPTNYEQTYKSLTMNGYRVLALGYRYLPNFRCDSIHLVNRDDSEIDITFIGFLVARCHLKTDTISCINEIKNSGHTVVMITGDNPLTACYVAKVSKMCDDKHIIYMLTNNKVDNDSNGWQLEPFSTEEIDTKLSPINFNPTQSSYCTIDNMFCICGEGLRYLMDDPIRYNWLKDNIQKVLVWARVDPEEKEIIIKLFKGLNYTTLMCGDGTNDMGALRQSCVGVAMLNNTHTTNSNIENEPKKKDSTFHRRPMLNRTTNNTSKNPNLHSKNLKLDTTTIRSPPKTLKETWETLEKEQLETSQIVKLGDASIAAPFTLKSGRLISVCDIINQGRCTLVTTLQMFRILAINSLITAYSQSVHYSYGIRMGDYQATMHAIIVTFSFFFVSNTEAAPRLTRNIPLANLFNIYMILSVTMQSLIHLGSIILISHYALYSVYKDLKFDIDTKFEPNILNSVMFITTIILQVTTFAVNYHGRPFMKSFWRHKKLRNSILATYFFVIVILFEWIPELNKNIQIVSIDNKIRKNVCIILVSDLILTTIIDKLIYMWFGEKKIE